MYKWFNGISTVEELKKRYKELIKKHHPDNANGSVEATQEINREYDLAFQRLSHFKDENGESSAEEEKAENEAFKDVLNEIINFDMEIEIIGSWIWCFNSYAYKDRLKTLGFRFAPKKKCWCWHFGEYKKHHKGEVSLDEIRMKYGSQTVNRKSRQYALND